jgi:hypothetical protein
LGWRFAARAASALLGAGCLIGAVLAQTTPREDDDARVPVDAASALLKEWAEGESLPPLEPISPEDRARRVFERGHPYARDVFQVGEKLVFSVRYGPVRAGEATMTIAGIEQVGQDSCYHIVSSAASNDFFSTFFHVRDRYETYMDTQWLLSRRYEKHLSEGEYRNSAIVEMDQRHQLAIYDNGKVFEMLPGSHDVLSAFYVTRTLPLVVGSSFDLDSHVDRKNYPIRVQVHRREHIEVPVGEFDCLVVEPVMRSPGLFEQKGRVLIWLTDDRRRIPVQVKSELPIGAISIVLVDVQGRSDWVRD